MQAETSIVDVTAATPPTSLNHHTDTPNADPTPPNRDNHPKNHTPTRTSARGEMRGQTALYR